MLATRPTIHRATTLLVVRSALQVGFAALLILGFLPALVAAAGG